VIFVDPSGRGKDETAWAVMKNLNGVLYLLKVGHEVSDPTKAMTEIAMDARRFGVHMIEVEPNFGQGMWVAAFQPILTKIWAKGGATVQESEWAKGQKETRIIDTLEPVLTQHRLVVSESFLREDAAEEDRNYSFLYQLTGTLSARGLRAPNISGPIGSRSARTSATAHGLPFMTRHGRTDERPPPNPALGAGQRRCPGAIPGSDVPAPSPPIEGAIGLHA
jgi:hypothetical protein